MHRFFVPPDRRVENEVALSGDIAHQIARVLRLRANEEIVLIPTDAADAVEWRVRLVAVEAHAVRGSVVAERSGLSEPACAVTLCAALLKGERFDWLLQKATELGVAAIQPIVTAHTIRKLGPDDEHAQDRWRRIVTEAAEQSGRSRVPAMCGPVPLRGLANAVPAPLFVAHETVAARTLAEAIPAEAERVAVAIGPEGGFSDDEVTALVADAGAIPVSLGPRVLRAETAAITAVTLVMATTGNLVPPRERAWREFRDT
ncbi:MAG: 16S rRNA (uracil(1498)-N(3))-methyltransferase [Thermomicrobia bacterium]|nr:16S rRNA (uracil(1498)-N(3))-methyltransferase [Thermomicrobia bacterium]MCA1725080.1 16S rRNA (uracil(1498)-N(3))-methyltransferase [Thermomicrobia bacterium]